MIDSGLLELKCYKNINKSLVFTAHFTDSTLNVYHGLFRSYYTNGNLENEGYYLQGKENGLWQKLDIFQNITDSIYYENGIKMMIAKFTYYPNQNIESIVIDDIVNKKLYRSFYNEKGTLMDEDALKENKEDPDKVFIKAEIEPSFPGGSRALQVYITKRLEESEDLAEDNVSGTCRVTFIVDKDWNVSDIQAVTMQSSVLAKVARNAIAKGPKWIPAQQNGRSVTAYKVVTVTYPIPDK